MCSLPAAQRQRPVGVRTKPTLSLIGGRSDQFSRRCDPAGTKYSLARVTCTGIMDCPAEGRQGCEGLNGFDFAHRIKGSVPVQARDHRKRRCNQLSAESNQRDFALAA
jgi:hypothetical protein